MPHGGGGSKNPLLHQEAERLVFVPALIPVHYCVKCVSKHATFLVESGGPTRLCASSVPASTHAQAHMADSAQHTLFCEREPVSDLRALFPWVSGRGPSHLVLLKVRLHCVMVLGWGLWKSQETQEDQSCPQHAKSSHLLRAEQVSGPEASNVDKARKTGQKEQRALWRPLFMSQAWPPPKAQGLPTGGS